MKRYLQSFRALSSFSTTHNTNFQHKSFTKKCIFPQSSSVSTADCRIAFSGFAPLAGTSVKKAKLSATTELAAPKRVICVDAFFRSNAFDVSTFEGEHISIACETARIPSDGDRGSTNAFTFTIGKHLRVLLFGRFFRTARTSTHTHVNATSLCRRQNASETPHERATLGDARRPGREARFSPST